MDKQRYEVVTLRIEETEVVESIIHLFGRSISYIDIRLELNVTGKSANLEMGSFIDDEEDVYPFEATAIKNQLMYSE